MDLKLLSPVNLNRPYTPAYDADGGDASIIPLGGGGVFGAGELVSVSDAAWYDSQGFVWVHVPYEPSPVMVFKINLIPVTQDAP